MGHSELNDDDDDLAQLLLAAETHDAAVEQPPPVATTASPAQSSASLRESSAFMHDLANGTAAADDGPSVATPTKASNGFSATLNRSARKASEAEKSGAR